MGDLVRAFKTTNSFRGYVHHSENENDEQCDKMRSFPRNSYSTPLNARLGFENCELATRSSPFVSGYVASRTKQVYLYKWFLIRVVGNDPDNGINHNGVQVALGGYTTSDLLDKKSFTTAPIESRIEKCKLRTFDGLNILLMGAIDEQCTYDNGFPFEVIHLFVNGFPFHWNHVINVYFGQLRLTRSVLSARKSEENAGQQKDEALNCEHVGKQIKGVGIGRLSFQEPRENISNVSSSESSAECSKIGKYGMQPSVLSAGKGEDNTSQQTNGVPNPEHVEKQAESMEAGELSFQEPGENTCKAEENMFKAEENMLNLTSPGVSSSKCSKSRKYKMQPIRSSRRLNHNRLNMRCEPGTPSPFVDSHEDSNVLRESASSLSSFFRTVSVKEEVKTPQPKVSDVETQEQADMDDNLMVTVHHAEKDSFKGEKNVSKSVISHSIKDNRVSKNQIDSRVFLEDGAKQGLVNKETGQLPTANVLLEQLKNKCTSAGEQTQDIHIPALEVPETSCKKSKLRSKVNLSSKRDGRNVLSSLPEAILCDETTVTECVNMASDVKHAAHLEEIICTRPLDAEHSAFDPKARLLPNEIIGPGIDDKRQCGVNSLVDAVELGFQLKEDALSGCGDNMPCEIAENHVSDRSLKRGRDRNRSKLSDSPVKQSKEFVSTQTTVMDDMMKKCNDIDATRGSNPYLVPCKIQHDITSKHCAEIGSNCLDKSGGKEEGCLYTQRLSTENNGQTSTKTGHNFGKLPSIPPRRVKTTPEEVSKAFGLKTSRFGRLIVPPLAHWCNQTVAYDLDGSLIAIFDGSSQREQNGTAFNFKPPQQKDAVKIRRKLCDAANEIIRTPSSVKKMRKD